MLLSMVQYNMYRNYYTEGKSLKIFKLAYKTLSKLIEIIIMLNMKLILKSLKILSISKLSEII